MAKVHVTAKRDFIETLTTAKPLAALAEIIWNGFDANANKVQVFLVLNDLKRIETIRIRDFGYGIDHSKIDAFFGNLGDSWKKAKHREFYRVLHGKNGKGRFKAFALGKNIEWSTTYQDPKNNKYFSYKIVGNASTIDDFEISDPAETNNRSTGTEVIIYNPEYDFRSLRDGQIYLELAKIFAVYLTEYPGLILEYDGIKVDPQSVQSNYADYPLGVRISSVVYSIQENTVDEHTQTHSLNIIGSSGNLAAVS
ncbi:MAG: ATP-binding protein, partial [Nitrosomonas sp.]